MSSLYLDHFGLSKPPFQITPDPDFFFSGGRRGDILSALGHVAAHDEGITTVVAEVGSGKTLLARLMIGRLGAGISAVYLANPFFSRDEIIEAISRDLGLTSPGVSMEGKLAALQHELLRRHATGQRVLLVIDEAHTMPVESLEEVRLLSNLETGQHKLVNIMLFGQPELDDLLAQPKLRQVRDRVIHRFDLERLHDEEISAYIDHRLRAAGWSGARLFTEAAMAQLVKVSDGRARRINLLSDKALLAAYADGARSVDTPHVKAAMAELPEGQLSRASQISPGRSRFGWRLAGIGLALAIVPALAVLALLRPPANSSGPAAPGALQPIPTPAAAPSALTAPLHFESSLASVPQPRKKRPTEAAKTTAEPPASAPAGVKPEPPASAPQAEAEAE
ncbi:MAG: hypothetical protein RIS90_1756 [Pseudomonadota bacterium]